MEENTEVKAVEAEKKVPAKRAARKPVKRTRKPVAAVVLSENAPEKFNIGIKVNASSGEGIIYFGEVDINKAGKPSSDYPSHFFDRPIEELKRDVEALERGLHDGVYVGKERIKSEELLKQKKERYEAIISAKPKLRDGDKDAMDAVQKELGKRIGESMFTFTDMQKGTADAHVEADRMVNPCIKVGSRLEAEYFKQRDIEIKGGKVSRNHATQAWQTFRKILGEGIIDAEVLRNQR